MNKKTTFIKSTEYMKNSDWGKGEWLNEPDMHAIIEFKYKNHTCILTRNFAGSWCGYVEIPIDSKYATEIEQDKLNIHGGLTWNSKRLPLTIQLSSDHSNSYWLGFDCSHFGDYSPRLDKTFGSYLTRMLFPNGDSFTETYKTLEFAKNELIQLIEQIESDKD